MFATKSFTALRMGGGLAARSQKRNLNIHEYQSKQLMDKFGVRCQKWRLVDDAVNAKNMASQLSGELVLKAQVHAGGRGLGHFKENGFKSGVHFCKTGQEAEALCKNMLGYSLITKQTPPEGVLVRKVMIAESVNIVKEYYFAILMDRASGGPVMVASTEGGMDIEDVAHNTPDKIYREAVDIKTGVKRTQSLKLAKQLGFSGAAAEDAATQMENLYKLFIACDATQVEINPLAVVDTGKIFAVDAKINFDDNASFRQKDIFAMRDTAEEDPREVAASKHNLNYIGMDGDIACMVNGAGLAMATMDIIKLYKGTPANFLDVGGGADEAQVTEAFKILNADPRVKTILVNIFGGIMKCDTIANGIVGAMKQVDMKMPLVVRLAGTNVAQGKEILSKSGFNIITADDLDDAAQKAVAARTH